jgi:ribosomal-protein-alanine acetyltransferase
VKVAASPVLRPAGPSDVDALAALERELFGVDAWSADAVGSELTGSRRHAVVAVQEEEVVGYAVTLLGDGVVDLQRVAVIPAYRRKGLARELLGAVRAAARAGGAHRMLLEVSAANEAARAFYAEAGFEEIDRRPRYYRDGSDALVLQALLQTGGTDG